MTDQPSPPDPSSTEPTPPGRGTGERRRRRRRSSRPHHRLRIPLILLAGALLAFIAGMLGWLVSDLWKEDVLAKTQAGIGVKPAGSSKLAARRVVCPGEDQQGLNPAFAAACGAKVALRNLLTTPEAANRPDPRPEFAGRTALHHAVQREDTGMIVALLAAGANPNQADGAGNTPLHLLAITPGLRHPEFAARRLIDGGARVDMRNARGFTPIEELERDHDHLLNHQSLAKVLFREDPRGASPNWLELPDTPEDGDPGNPGRTQVDLKEAPVILQTQEGTIILPPEPPAAGHPRP